MDSFSVNPRPEGNQCVPSESRFELQTRDASLCSEPTPPSLVAPAADGSKQERRKKRRALISVPVRIRAVDIARPAADEVTTVDVSRTGILLLTSNQSFHRGMDVAVTFPYTKASDLVQAEKLARVVRVSATLEGLVSVAIAFGVTFQDSVAPSIAEPAGNDLCRRVAFASDPKKPLVLLVESEGSIRGETKAFLCSQGYEVIAVVTAGDAREVLNMFTPSLLIAEIEGEGLPGFDLCAHVKASPRLRHVPVMLTTCSAYPSDYSSAHSLGAVVCMAKPYRLERLGHVVGLLAPTPGAKKCNQPPRAADPSRWLRRPGQQRNHPRLRFG